MKILVLLVGLAGVVVVVGQDSTTVCPKPGSREMKAGDLRLNHRGKTWVSENQKTLREIHGLGKENSTFAEIVSARLCRHGFFLWGDSRSDPRFLTSNDFKQGLTDKRVARSGESTIQFLTGKPVDVTTESINVFYTGVNLKNTIRTSNGFALIPGRVFLENWYESFLSLLAEYRKVRTVKAKEDIQCKGRVLIVADTQGRYESETGEVFGKDVWGCRMVNPIVMSGNLRYKFAANSVNVGVPDLAYCFEERRTELATFVFLRSRGADEPQATSNDATWSTDTFGCNRCSVGTYLGSNGLNSTCERLSFNTNVLNRGSACGLADSIASAQKVVCDRRSDCHFIETPEENGCYPSGGKNSGHAAPSVIEFFDRLVDESCNCKRGGYQTSGDESAVTVDLIQSSEFLCGDMLVPREADIRIAMPPFSLGIRQGTLGAEGGCFILCFGIGSLDTKFDELKSNLNRFRDAVNAELKETRRGLNKVIMAENQIANRVNQLSAALFGIQNRLISLENFVREDHVHIRRFEMQQIKVDRYLLSASEANSANIQELVDFLNSGGDKIELEYGIPFIEDSKGCWSPRSDFVLPNATGTLPPMVNYTTFTPGPPLTGIPTLPPVIDLPHIKLDAREFGIASIVGLILLVIIGLIAAYLLIIHCERRMSREEKKKEEQKGPGGMEMPGWISGSNLVPSSGDRYVV